MEDEEEAYILFCMKIYADHILLLLLHSPGNYKPMFFAVDEVRLLRHNVLVWEQFMPAIFSVPVSSKKQGVCIGSLADSKPWGL